MEENKNTQLQDSQEPVTIVLYDDEGTEITMEVLETTRINGVDYLLVAEDEDAYILKDVSKPEEEEARYEFVEDDQELEYIGKVFSEILEDVDLE